VAACSPTLAFEPRADAVDFSIFLASNRKPFDEAGNLDSNNRVALVCQKVRINVCPIADSDKPSG
jgi:hypothetical protein